MPLAVDPSVHPRSIYTRSELIEIVRGKLALRNARFVTDADVAYELNQAQTWYARKARWFRNTDQSGVVAGTGDYAFPSPATGQCIEIVQVYYDNRKIYEEDEEYLIRSDPAWETHSGTPYCYLVRGNSSVRLYPKPAVTDPDILDWWFVGIPPRVDGGTGRFYIPYGNDDALVQRACWQISLKDFNGEGRYRVPEFERASMMYLREMTQQVQTNSRDRMVAFGQDQALAPYGPGGYLPWRTSITAP